jgi:urease accessory protein
LNKRVSWVGSLSLDFERSGHQTVIARRRHRGPLLVQRPFHEPDGTCQVYLIHPPGGVVGGDSLVHEFDLRRESRALITTPGATKLYRSPELCSTLRHDVVVAAGGVFEWLPQETIVFSGALAESSARVRLEGSSSQFIGWDITCLGHDNAGLRRGRVTQSWELTRDGRCLWRERADHEGGAAALSAPWGLAGRTVVGTLIATGSGSAEVEAVRAALPEADRDWLSVSRLGEVLLCRYLGYSAEAAKHRFGAAWAILRRQLFGRSARPPRVWAT